LSASQRGDLLLIRTCIEAGNVPTDARDRDGFTPLHYACWHGQEDAALVLLYYHADLAARDNGRDLRGADVHLLHAQRSTPLHVAAHAGHISLVSTLLLHGADPAATDAEGNTPLHRACAAGRGDVVRFLLHAARGFGVVLDRQLPQPNAQGVTPLACLPAPALLAYLFDRPAPFPLLVLKEQQFIRWFFMLQLDDGCYALPGYGPLTVGDVVTGYVQEYPELVFVKDRHGRVAMDVAAPAVREVFRKVLLWHGRYRVTEAHPEHASAATWVYKAVDEHAFDAHNQPVRVALKLTRSVDKVRVHQQTQPTLVNTYLVFSPHDPAGFAVRPGSARAPGAGPRRAVRLRRAGAALAPPHPRPCSHGRGPVAPHVSVGHLGTAGRLRHRRRRRRRVLLRGTIPGHR
jgi:ankyrin repeat protein